MNYKSCLLGSALVFGTLIMHDCIIPILSGVSDFVQTVVGKKTGELSMEFEEEKLEHENYMNLHGGTETETQAIGFTAGDVEEYNGEDSEDE